MQIELINDDHSCPNCYYEWFDDKAYPCSRCIHNKPSEDMFRPKLRAEQTEHSDNSCKTCRYGEVDEGYVLCKYHSKAEQTEPQTEECPFDDAIPCEWVCTEWGHCKYKPKDEPQTEGGE